MPIKALTSLFSVIITVAVLVFGHVPEANAGSVTAGGIFSMIGSSTTTIDKGGAIHSQARSIYSMGGGMASFQGKRVTLLAADPPSFSAGCNGISWHFGGFSFISLDEIRQLVESVAQASLGIVVDLAMQTLCPQCYAVMSKLRDIANQMRNAAADACKIAQNFGALLQANGILPTADKAQMNCSTMEPRKAGEDGYLASQVGTAACAALGSVQTVMKGVGEDINGFLNGRSSGEKTPPRDQIDQVGNMTYKALRALGYPEGITTDLLLSIFGMEVIPAKPGTDCTPVTASLGYMGPVYSDNPALATPGNPPPSAKTTDDAMAMDVLDEGSVRVTGTAEDTPKTHVDDATYFNPKAPVTASTDATTSRTRCHLPPLITDLPKVAQQLVCGFDPIADLARFTQQYKGSAADSINGLCGKATSSNAEIASMRIYRCSGSGTAGCTLPRTEMLRTAMNTSGTSQYTGLAFMVLAALYDGTSAVAENKPLPPATVALLNGVNYPLYRLINLAAVYPSLADGLLGAYGATIASQFAMDTMSKLMAPGGATTQISMLPENGIQQKDLLRIRSDIMEMTRTLGEASTTVLKRLQEKQMLIDQIVKVNKALQAEVVSQGMAGNSSLAASIKRYQQ